MKMLRRRMSKVRPVEHTAHGTKHNLVVDVACIT